MLLPAQVEVKSLRHIYIFIYGYYYICAYDRKKMAAAQVAKKLKDRRQKQTLTEIFKKVKNMFYSLEQVTSEVGRDVTLLRNMTLSIHKLTIPFWVVSCFS